MRSVADAIVQHLVDAGVTTIFGVPGGGSNLDLIAAAGRAGLRFVLTATETAAAIAAIAQAEIAQAEIGGRPGACLTTLGPGVASVVNGVACASLDRAPLIVFTDAPPAAMAAFAHQRLDHHALLAPVVKWSATLTPERPDAVMAAAVARALAHPRGPVHIECPADVLGQAARGEEAGQVARVGQVGQVGRVETAQAIESIVAAARRPLVLVGLGARDREAATAVRQLCVSHNLDALVTYKAKGVVPDSDPHFAGVFTHGVAEADAIAGADALIGIGLDPIELLPRPWPYRQPIVNITPYEVACEHVPFIAQWVGEVDAGVRRIAKALRPAADRRRPPTRLATAAARAGLAPGRVVELVAGAFPDARVTVDAGAHMFPATLLWPVAEPARMLISNGLSTMGFALPAAIGAAVVDSGARVVALTGDGGLLMCAGELLTAARERLPIVVVVFNDAALTLIDIKQRQREHPAAGVALGSVGWRALAESVGLAGHVASTEDELRAALAAARDADGPSLIEAMIDPRGYDAMFKALRG